MSEFRLALPEPLEPDDLIVEVHAAIRKSDLTGEDRDVADELCHKALGRGVVRAVDLVAELEGPGDRAIVDEARVSAGLRTIEDEAAHKRFEMANDQTLLRARRAREIEIDFATMSERPIGRHAEQARAKEARELAILRERDAVRRVEAEERRRAREARAAASARLLGSSFGGPG